MVNLNPNGDDFCAKALASLNQQMTLAGNAAANAAAAGDVESYAKSLVEDDHPKIDSAVKGYLSLVAARSAVASEVDVVSTSSSALDASTAQCTFASSAKTPMDANRCALACARTLLSVINSTTVPPKSSVDGRAGDETKIGGEESTKAELRKNAAHILWNRLVQQSSSGTDDKAKRSKPSRVLGRESLQVAYPYVRERLRRGIMLNDNRDSTSSAAGDKTRLTSQSNNPLHSLPNELLPPVNPPKGIEVDQWEAFFAEFGSLLNRACGGSGEEGVTASRADDDSALLWSGDWGSAELRRRREVRARRAAEALASTDGEKAAVKDAVLGTVAEDGGN